MKESFLKNCELTKLAQALPGPMFHSIDLSKTRDFTSLFFVKDGEIVGEIRNPETATYEQIARKIRDIEFRLSKEYQALLARLNYPA